MTETEFEEFGFELLKELGFINVDWRKGTGLDASPSDGGRDIVAYRQIQEFDGSHHLEKWFIDCKNHKRGIPPDKITSILSWAAAERADVALVIASNYLSNPCKDFIDAYKENNRPTFRIKYWERPNLQALISGRDEFLSRIESIRRRHQDCRSGVMFELDHQSPGSPESRRQYEETYFHLVSARLIKIFPGVSIARREVDVDGTTITVRFGGRISSPLVDIHLKPFPIASKEQFAKEIESKRVSRIVPRVTIAVGLPAEISAKYGEKESAYFVRAVQWRGSADDADLQAVIDSAIKWIGEALGSE